MDRIEIGEVVLSPYIPYRPTYLRKEAGNVTAMFGKIEWKFLYALWHCAGTLVTRDYLWVYVYPDPRKRPDIRSVDVLACKVRKKLTNFFEDENCIRHIRGLGYMFYTPQ